MVPLTDDEYAVIKPWADKYFGGWEHTPKPDLTPKPPILSLIPEEVAFSESLQLEQGLLTDDPQTGEIYPLRGPVFLLHCDATNTKLGLWQISEEAQLAMYPDSVAGRANHRDGQESFACRKTPQCSWASVVERITGSMNINSRWYALANPDNLTLAEMFKSLGLGDHGAPDRRAFQ